MIRMCFLVKGLDKFRIVCSRTCVREDITLEDVTIPLTGTSFIENQVVWYVHDMYDLEELTSQFDLMCNKKGLTIFPTPLEAVSLVTFDSVMRDYVRYLERHQEFKNKILPVMPHIDGITSNGTVGLVTPQNKTYPSTDDWGTLNSSTDSGERY